MPVSCSELVSIIRDFNFRFWDWCQLPPNQTAKYLQVTVKLPVCHPKCQWICSAHMKNIQWTFNSTNPNYSMQKKEEITVVEGTWTWTQNEMKTTYLMAIHHAIIPNIPVNGHKFNLKQNFLPLSARKANVKCIQRLNNTQCIHAMQHMSLALWSPNSSSMSMQWVENRTYRSLCVIVSMKISTTMWEPCKCVISLLQIAIGNI